MIRITVELLPRGREDNRRVLGIGEIANDGTGTAELGNYVATFSKWAPQTGEIWRAAHLVGFDRKDRGPWDLLLACLIAALHDRRMEAAQGKTISPGVAKRLLARPPLLGRDVPHHLPAPQLPVHRLKSWPEAFEAVLAGEKRHEVRKDDRGFAPGDGVILAEWDPICCEHTGRTASFTIGEVTKGGRWGLPVNTCVFTLLDREAPTTPEAT